MKQRIKKKLLSKNPKTKEEFKLESTGKLSPLPNLNQSIQKYNIKKNIFNNNISNDSLINQSKKEISLLNMTRRREKNNSYINKNRYKLLNNIERINGKKTKTLYISHKKNNKKRKIIKFNNTPVKNRTIFEKIIENIDKIKIKTNKTLNIIKKNMKISNQEICNRTNKLFSYDKIFKNNKINPNRNMSHSHNMKNNINNLSLNFSSNNILLDDISQINSNDKSNKKDGLLLKEDLSMVNKMNNNLGIIKIPSISLNSIKQKNFRNINRMYHYRNFNISEESLENKLEKFFMINNLTGNKTYIKEKKMQFTDIFNKINLVLDNIDYFKRYYMYKDNFYSAFDNMENRKKAEFNLVLEEICVLLIQVVPKLLKKFYENLDILLYVTVPNIGQEMEKEPENEKECLNLNFLFFNTVSFYFLGCVEILKEIQKRIEYFKYTYSEYNLINKYLNLVRYDSSKINSIANIHISKTVKDKEILEKLEIGLGIKEKKETFNDDILERFHKRLQNQKILYDSTKINRINSALNLSNNSFNRKKFGSFKKTGKNILEKKDIKSLLNNPLVTNMMKYFKNNIKSQILSQQVIERYRTKEQLDNQIYM